LYASTAAVDPALRAYTATYDVPAGAKDRIRLPMVRKPLLRQGIDVSYPNLHRFAISELGFGKRRLTIPAPDCDPREELQVDTGWMLLLEPDERGQRRRFLGFIFTAVRSRHRFVYPTFTGDHP
jgi:hypothetical protein